MPIGRLSVCASIAVVVLAFACASITEKPCRPGCVDDQTRLVCDGGAARAVRCPTSSEPCAAPLCREGACGYRPRIGETCGADGLATCNEGYACLGPHTKLTALRFHTCALDDEGKIWCWGLNPAGELGDGTTEDSGYPVPVPLPRPAIDVSAGYSHTCAVLDDKSVYCWGNNIDGKVAPGSPDFYVSVPARVDAADARFVNVSAAGDHTCAITEQSTVWCWGSTIEGQCGVDGPAANVESVGPTQVPGLDEVRSIESGLTHTCAVRRGSPSLLCWGSNRDADLGELNGKLGPAAEGLAYSATPVVVTDVGPLILDVGMGYESTYAVSVDGDTYAWGSNAHAQLGVNLPDAVVTAPTPVVSIDDKQEPQSLGLVSEVLRSDSTDQCAKMQILAFDSRYLCWGTDEYGELGFGSKGETVLLPKAMNVLPESAANLVRGERHTCFTAERDGTVDIECFGQAFLIANGTKDHVADQLLPSPVRWDPRLFERYIAR